MGFLSPSPPVHGPLPCLAQGLWRVQRWQTLPASPSLLVLASPRLLTWATNWATFCDPVLVTRAAPRLTGGSWHHCPLWWDPGMWGHLLPLLGVHKTDVLSAEDLDLFPDCLGSSISRDWSPAALPGLQAVGPVAGRRGCCCRTHKSRHSGSAVSVCRTGSSRSVQVSCGLTWGFQMIRGGFSSTQCY